MKKEILNIETVHQCNCCMGCKTLHPLVSVVDLSEANLEQRTIRCDFYTIILIEGEAGKLMYGRKYYDYSNATLIFRMPGEKESHYLDRLKSVAGSALQPRFANSLKGIEIYGQRGAAERALKLPLPRASRTAGAGGGRSAGTNLKRCDPAALLV